MPQIPSDPTRATRRAPENLTSGRALPVGTLFTDGETREPASFASLIKDGSADASHPAQSGLFQSSDEPSVQAFVARQRGGAATGNNRSVTTEHPDGVHDAKADKRKSEQDDTDQGGHDEHTDGSTVPADESAVAAAPDTIQMLNELLLIGGPTRRASAQLRGDDMPAPSASNYTAGEQGGTPGTRVIARDRPAPLNENEPSSVAREPVASIGAADKHGEKPAADGAASTNLGQNNATSLRDQRSSDEQPQHRDKQSDPSTSAVQKPAALTPADALASLRAFAAINTKPGAEPAQSAAHPSRPSGTPPITPLTSGDPSVAQASAKQSAQPAQVAQAHPPASTQMFRGISSAMKSDATGGSALISLRPESLGEVKIRVDVQDGQVSATFEAATPMARDLLNRSLVELRGLLHSRGLTVDRLDVSLRDEPRDEITPGSARTDAQQHAQAVSGDPSQDEMDHTGEADSRSFPTPGGAGNNAGSGAREDPAWRPGRSREGRSESLESAEPVLEHVGTAPAWRVDGLIDTLA